MQQGDAPCWISTEQASQILGVTKQRVIELARKGFLLPDKTTRPWRFNKAEVLWYARWHEEIKRVRAELAELRRKEKALQQRLRPYSLRLKIARIEELYPDSAEWSRFRLVKKGETLDEWIERVAKRMRSWNPSKDEQQLREDAKWHYEQFRAIPKAHYLRWLFELGDPRIVDTEAYARWAAEHPGSEAVDAARRLGG